MTKTRRTATSSSLPTGFDLIEDLALYFNRSGELVDWNQSFEGYLGNVDNDALSTGENNVFSAEDQKRLATAVTEALKSGGETVRLTVSVHRPSNTTAEISLSLTSVSDEWTTEPRVVAIAKPAESRELRRHEDALQHLYEVISDEERTIETKINDLLAYLRTILGTDFATLSRVEDDEYIFRALDTVEGVDIAKGDSVPLAWTNCERVIASRETLVLDDIKRQAPALANKKGNTTYGINSYLGAPITIGDDVYGTLCFYRTESSAGAFSDWQVSLVNIVSKWIGYEFETDNLSEDLRQRDQERYEALVRQSNDAIMVVRDGKFDFVNERYAEIAGYDKTEMIGMPFEDVVAPEFCDLVRERYQKRIAGESPPDTYEVEIVTGDGERRVLELSSTRLTKSGESVVLANARDVTQRKRLEEATTALHDATERIQKAETASEIADIVIEAGRDILDLPYAVCWIHDDETRTLEPVAMTDAIRDPERDRTYSAGHYQYEVFRDGEVTRFTPSEALEDGSFATGYLFPLGTHGLLGLGYPEPIEMDSVLFELAETVAEHATTALDRVVRTEELRESERRYRAIFNQTYQFTGLMEPDGAMIEANKTALEFGNLDKNDVVGKKVWDAYWFSHSAELQEQIKAAVKQAASGEFVREEIPVRGFEQMVIIDFSIRPITDESGEVTLLIPEGRDITELKQREQELRKERDHIRRTEQLAGVGGWEITLDERTFTWTPGARRLYGVDETFEPTLDGAADYFHPDDWETVRETIIACWETGTAFDLEARMITALGQRRWVQLEGERVDSPTGRAIRGVIADITERREREQRLMVLNRVLRHNLRNQLGVISGYANMIESLLTPAERVEAPTETAETASTVQEIHTHETVTASGVEGDRKSVVETISTIKSFTIKIAANATELMSLAEKAQNFENTIKQVERSHSVSVRPLVLELVDKYRAEHPKVTIETDVADVSVWGNEEFIRGIINELLANAVEHSDQEMPSICISVVAKADGHVRLTVADDGPGMPEMERGVLKSGEESPLLHGSGVGLWTVNWLVSRLGGQITIVDNEPRGTVVTVHFPTSNKTSA